jgi:hypothetical protein
MSRARKAEGQRADGAARAAAIESVAEDRTHVVVRFARGGRGAPLVVARLALAAPYAPSIGDRVLVIDGEDEAYVVGVLHAAGPASIALPDGAEVRVEDGAAVIRDPEGRVVVRYANGSAEIAAPSGDLTLAAPEGRVVIRSGVDVEIDAARDVSHRAGRVLEARAGAACAEPAIRLDPAGTTLSTPRLDVTTKVGRLSASDATIGAQRLALVAGTLTQTASRLEVTAEKIVERARDTLRDVADLAETRVGRARTLVRDVFSLRSRRTTMISKDDTSVDGKRVLLG